LPFLVINHSHFVVLSRCQLGGFYQRTLDMFIALLRERAYASPCRPSSVYLRRGRSS
jgi:hypothetical protein